MILSWAIAAMVAPSWGSARGCGASRAVAALLVGATAVRAAGTARGGIYLS
eukprot:gene7249-40774_t